MTDLASMQAALVKAHDQGQLITCRFPGGSSTHAISMERKMLDQAMAAWRATDPTRHRGMLESVLRSIKRIVKRMKQGRATGKEMDAGAADIALWLAHELLYADGEKYLVKGPSRDDLLKASPQDMLA